MPQQQFILAKVNVFRAAAVQAFLLQPADGVVLGDKISGRGLDIRGGKLFAVRTGFCFAINCRDHH